VIEFRNIRKAFGPKPVLDDVSFAVKDGEVFFIIGASGVGKSVLIKHLVACSTGRRRDSGSTGGDLAEGRARDVPGPPEVRDGLPATRRSSTR